MARRSLRQQQAGYYGEDGTPTVSYKEPLNPKDSVFNHVRLQIENNWGNAHHTCLYSFRVKGSSGKGGAINAIATTFLLGVNTMSDEGTFLGTLMYDQDGAAFQTLKVNNPKDSVFDHVRLQVTLTLTTPVWSSGKGGALIAIATTFLLGVNTMSDEGTFLGTLTYDQDGAAFQTLKVNNPKDSVFNHVRLQVENNWGNAHHTCLECYSHLKQLLLRKAFNTTYGGYWSQISSSAMPRRSLRQQQAGYYGEDGTPAVSYKEPLVRVFRKRRRPHCDRHNFPVANQDVSQKVNMVADLKLQLKDAQQELWSFRKRMDMFAPLAETVPNFALASQVWSVELQSHDFFFLRDPFLRNYCQQYVKKKTPLVSFFGVVFQLSAQTPSPTVY
nr:PREDICTED: uncharacterized protein LOC103359682 [Stegastes partitus]